MTIPSDLPILFFETQTKWESWLEENHQSKTGIWLRIYKKGTGIPSLNYALALESALCYGWIDGQVRRYDEQSYLQRFTPRRTRSAWSKINTQHIERLQRAGRMKPAGLMQVNAAKKDGRWDQAYDSPSTMKIPDDFLDEIKKNKVAYEFFQTLNKTNLYAIAYQLQTAKKPETREKKVIKILTMLANGKKFH